MSGDAQDRARLADAGGGARPAPRHLALSRAPPSDCRGRRRRLEGDSSAAPDLGDGRGGRAATMPFVPVAIDEPEVELSLCAFLPAVAAARCELRLQSLLNQQIDVQILLDDLVTRPSRSSSFSARRAGPTSRRDAAACPSSAHDCSRPRASITSQITMSLMMTIEKLGGRLTNSSRCRSSAVSAGKTGNSALWVALKLASGCERSVQAVITRGVAWQLRKGCEVARHEIVQRPSCRRLA